MNNQVKLVVKTHFDAAHKLPNYKGQCANLHGHTWVVRIEITGDKDPKTGMLIDFKKIKKIINKFDHNFINKIIKNPTAENLAFYLREQFLKLKGVKWVKIVLWESPDCYAEVSGHSANEANDEWEI